MPLARADVTELQVGALDHSERTAKRVGHGILTQLKLSNGAQATTHAIRHWRYAVPHTRSPIGTVSRWRRRTRDRGRRVSPPM